MRLWAIPAQSRLASAIGTPVSIRPEVEACPDGLEASRRAAISIGTPDSFAGVTETSGNERASSRLARLIETPVSGVSDGVAAA